MIHRNPTSSILWNLVLLTAGSVLFALGINGAVINNSFITGGLYGATLLVYYKTQLLSPSLWYLIFNIPLFVLGWFFVGRRFFWYSLYGMLVITLATQWVTFDFQIKDQLYAAIAGGIVSGAGSGIILRSIGSAGGLDIAAIMLNTRFNLGVGKIYMLFNVLLFGLTISFYTPDIIIASIILVFISSTTVEHVLSLFNQRKIVYVISEKNEAIAKTFSEVLRQGATFIKAKGAFSGNDRLILMAITNNLQLKKLENAVFNVDEHALFIVENSFNVIGSTFGKRKIY
ncbi:YitT family protein [Desulfobulbus rhabdoformis]|uniref:YitT family protein n=1 Tax=Desulfobulbus rhabdoformis TaxID=34032 RepID=UPI001963ABB1|nr:YitT family protein [Desulfobulbus rhabdoformis]MBM9613847.1 YitT family protein [Desulfobulbus rhabdoformis]